MDGRYSMALNEGASLFIPLLFLVVTEISAIARDLDLKSIASDELPPFWIGLFYALDSAPDGRVDIPQLGRFNFIHGANLAIITLGFVLVTATTDGFSGQVVALLTWIVWVMLPVLEVDEYEAILETGRPVSFYHHFAVSTVAALFAYFYDDALRALSVSRTAVTTAAFAAGLVALYYAALYGFLALLKRELDRHLARGGSPSDDAPSDGSSEVAPTDDLPGASSAEDSPGAASGGDSPGAASAEDAPGATSTEERA